MKHNKRRSTGIMYELLLREVSSALIEGDQKSADTAADLLRRHFSKGSELYRELRLFNALVRTSAVSSSTAHTILDEARSLAKSIDRAKLDKEKSVLIHEVNRKVAKESFYSRRVPDYRMYATIQTLLNDWRQPNVDNLTRRAEFEGKVREWLISERIDPSVEAHLDPDVDPLVLRIMTEKVEEKIRGSLSPGQVDLLEAYILQEGAQDVDDLACRLASIKDEALDLLEEYLAEESNEVLNEKSERIKEDIETLPTTGVDDEILGRYLTVVNLIETLQEGA